MAKEFAKAEGRRIEITNEQTKQIRDMYRSIERDFKERIRILSNRTNISSVMRTKYLEDFTKDLEASIKTLNSRLENMITNNMADVANAVVKDNEQLLHNMGIEGVFTKMQYIPQNCVDRIVSGKIYEGKWTLSKAIWSDNQKKIDDIHYVIAKGMAENKSTFEIAKDLERYVNPQARKLWDWSKVYPGTSKKIDYNAQRLARTMVSHAYEEAFVESTKDNPFIESYRWLASGGDRMCDLCAERDGKIFAKDELPLDHPNGMCTFEIVMEKSYDQIASDLKNWVNGTGDSELNEQLDNYADTLGYNVKEWTKNSEQVQNANSVQLNALELLQEYVSGTGESISETFIDNPEELKWIKNNMETYKSKTFYRLEQERFTARKLEIGDTFSFQGDLRSFAGSIQGRKEIERNIAEFDNIKDYVIFKTVGEQKAFDVNKFINNQYFENQDEYILGGKFKVIDMHEIKETVNGESITMKMILIK